MIRISSPSIPSLDAEAIAARPDSAAIVVHDHVQNLEDVVQSGRTDGPSRITVAPVIKDESARHVGDVFGQGTPAQPVDIEGGLVPHPVDTIEVAGRDVLGCRAGRVGTFAAQNVGLVGVMHQRDPASVVGGRGRVREVFDVGQYDQRPVNSSFIVYTT
jgi:hypothetical protein